MLYILLGMIIITIGSNLFLKKDNGRTKTGTARDFLSSKLLGGLLIIAGLISFALGLISRLVPHTVVSDSGCLSGAAAILGSAFQTSKPASP